MEKRTEYVIPIEIFTYTNSLGKDFEMETKLYITKVLDKKNDMWLWDVWVGADDYGYREFLFGLPTSSTALSSAIEYGINDYYVYQTFQKYVMETE